LLRFHTRLLEQTMRTFWVWKPAALALCAAMAAGSFAEAPAPAGSGLIVFSSNRSGPWRIWAVRPDGSDLRELAKPQTRPGEGASDASDVDPCFSPDGKTILFSSTRGGTVGVWRMPLDGSRPAERICDGDQAEWSPDGKRICFRRGEKVWTRDLAAGREKCLSPKDWPHSSGPAWSPDGKTIAFACRWDAGNAIFTVPADGGEPAKVYDQQGACEPHWSPDGRRLVYETEAHISTISPDGAASRMVTTFGGVQRYGRFSPDGKTIVFCQGASERGPWELYTIPAAGGAPTKVTEDGSDMNPDWK
jgi:Tol biopolymer transport system component